MKFNAERELVSVLKASLEHFVQNKKVKILEEVSLGHGIADVVITDLTHVDNSQYYDVSLNTKDVNLYVVIMRLENISKLELKKITGVSNYNLSISLNKLQVRGYIKFNDGIYSIDNSYVLHFKNSYAIEAKLKDWKKALKQAYRYKWFAEYSFVVLDFHYSELALRNIDMFINYNVGLATLTVDGVLTRHFTPQKQKPYDYKMQMLLSEKVKKLCVC